MIEFALSGNLLGNAAATELKLSGSVDSRRVPEPVTETVAVRHQPLPKEATDESADGLPGRLRTGKGS